MYSESIVARDLSRASEVLGFPLRRHSIAQVESAVNALNSLVREDGSLKRPLNPDERRFIRNERALSKYDFAYWATRYARIKHFSDNRIVAFHPNVAQRILHSIISDLQQQGLATMILQLKARQLGCSTFSELCVAHRVQFYSHVNAVVGSSRPEQSEKMAEMMGRCWDAQPWWLMPRVTSSRAGSLIEFGDSHSGVSIQHGAQLTGIARGDTPNVVHLSELCEYVNPEDSVDASLIRAMHEGPFTFLVLESTAMGRGNWWHRTWEFSKENWPHRRSKLCPIFLPWFIGTDIYPTPVWLRARPVPADWTPSQITIHHAERARAYVTSNSLLRAYLTPGWRMPREQMWFWEVTRAEYEAKRELGKFLSEMPADDLEAFQSTNISVFPVDVISVRREDTKPPLAVFGFIANQSDIPLVAQPARHEIDTSMPPVHVRYQAASGQHRLDCDLVPLKFPGYSSYDPFTKMFVWEWPQDNNIYGFGVDTSEGVGQDRSVFEIVRDEDIDRPAFQVAEFASPRLNSQDLWPFVLAAGQLFSTRAREGHLQRPLMAIECRWNGENVQLELIKRGWPNFHKWVRYDRRRLNIAAATKLGWYTNSWSRPMMMDHFIKAIRDDQLLTPSPYLVDELQDLELDEVGQSIKALHGAHDDRVMALGIIYFCFNILRTRGNMQSIAEARAMRQSQADVHPTWQPSWQARDEGPEEAGLADKWPVPDELREDDNG